MTQVRPDDYHRYTGCGPDPSTQTVVLSLDNHPFFVVEYTSNPTYHQRPGPVIRVCARHATCYPPLPWLPASTDLHIRVHFQPHPIRGPGQSSCTPLLSSMCPGRVVVVVWHQEQWCASEEAAAYQNRYALPVSLITNDTFRSVSQSSSMPLLPCLSASDHVRGPPTHQPTHMHFPQ